MPKFCKHSTCTVIMFIQGSDYCSSHVPSQCLYIGKDTKCNKETFHLSGLCPKHLKIAQNLVAKNKTTWLNLFRKGKIKELIQE